MKLIQFARNLLLGTTVIALAACNDSSSPSAQTAVTTTGTATTVAFAAAQYSTAATASSVTVVVNRSGGTIGSVSVNYATTNGTAVAGTDFKAMSGVLSWADGDATSKTIAIPLVNAKGGNAFTVALADPNGATIVSPNAANVSIMAAAPPAAATSSLSVRVQGDHIGIRIRRSARLGCSRSLGRNRAEL